MWPVRDCASTTRRSRPRRPVAQQREMAAEALQQVVVDVAQQADVVERDAVAVAEGGTAEADMPLKVGQRRPQMVEPSVEHLAAKGLGDVPVATGVGEGQFLLP